LNIVLPTYERPERFGVAVESAFCYIPNIERFVVVLQSDYDRALLSPRLTVLRVPATRCAGRARQVGFDYLAENCDPATAVFVMDDDMEICPGFDEGLPFVLDLLARTSTGLIYCAMKHKPRGKSRETTWGMVGGGLFCRLGTIMEIGGWGTDPLDDTHTFIKSALAGFRNYRCAQICNRHFSGSDGGLRAASGNVTMKEKRQITRAASQLDELYPGLFRRFDPERRVFDFNPAALPPKRR
jgi:hypothetical protein